MVDGSLEKTALGVPGELLLGGQGLARGYLNRPALTAEKFVPDPFAVEPGGRLYRTGDLVTWSTEGSLRYRGRIDHQVKIRGFRIELGEIEARLTEHPEVEEARVLVDEREGGRHLLAVLAGSEGGGPTTEALRRFLGERLPEYMVPTLFGRVPAFPRTATGKLDRRALLELARRSLAEAPAEYAPPRSREEEVLCEVFTAVLGREPEHPVGIRENFFEIGGDSIIAIQVITRARRAGLRLTSPREIFKHQTIEGLAACAAEAAAEGQPPAAGAVSPYPGDGLAEGRGRDGELSPDDFPLASLSQEELDSLLRRYPNLEDVYRLSPLQQGLLFHCLDEGDQEPAYIVQLGVGLEGPVRAEAMRRAWQLTMDRHAALRTVVVVEDSGPLQVVLSNIELAWTFTVASDGDDLGRWIEEDRRRPLDLQRAPILRMALIATGPESHVLVLTSHHLLMDGWSMPVLFWEAMELYRAAIRERPPALPPVQPYRRFIAWLQERDASADRDYWRGYLEGLRRPCPLPIPRAAAAVTGSGRPRFCDVRLSRRVSADLEAFARRRRLTQNVVCQAAWALLLFQATGERDVVFGITVSGRPAHLEGVETMVGMFINTLPVRLSIEPGTSVLGHLRRLQADQLERDPFQYLPLSEIQALSPLPRGSSLFETSSSSRTSRPATPPPAPGRNPCPSPSSR